jgi:mRNA-degrading endonuclease RelE of RelBE toxin-antitoxin system
MAWEIELTPEAQSNLSKLDPQIHRRILQFLNERLASWKTRAASARR